jgi:lysophospholipase L1-like esterase
MSATNGLAFSLRSRSGLIGCCMALVLLASALFASSAGAKAPLKPTAYVAIGDSLAFGYTEEKFDLNFPLEPVSAFEGGYVNVFAKKLAAAEKHAGNALSTIDLGCPGETSDGVIGHTEALGGGAGAEYDPCAYHFADGFPLHTEYAALGGSSQLEAAIGAVSTQEVKAVTINIGSNDELATVHKCEEASYDEAQGFAGGPLECITVEAGEGGHEYPGGLFKHIILNVGDVIGVLRHVGYAGPVVVLGFYNPQAEILPGSDALQSKLNEAFEGTIYLAKAFGPGVTYANPFSTFNPQNKNEPTKICQLTEECNPFDIAANKNGEGDIHPTPLGYEKLGRLAYKAL